MSARVLLNGISGFIGGHVAAALLAAGYTVRGSLRDPARAGAVRAALAAAGADVRRLECVTLTLTEDAGWAEAMAGCRFLVHTASPLPLRQPRDRAELVGPAVAGTERALAAALAAGVERIVLTSSMAAIAYGHAPGRDAPFTAADWTELSGPGVNAYTESKTRAERRAWEIMAAAGRAADLVAVNPGVVLGPLLDDDPGTSALLVARLLAGGLPALPRLAMTLVDVRDVAEAHRRALEAPGAGGRRVPMGESTLFLAEIAAILRDALPQAARRVPHRTLPDWMARLAALVVPELRSVRADLGQRRELDPAPAEALLGRPLRPARAAILATAESLLARGLA